MERESDVFLFPSESLLWGAEQQCMNFALQWPWTEKLSLWLANPLFPVAESAGTEALPFTLQLAF